MTIIDLQATDEPRIQQTAALLMRAFAEASPHSWPTLASALEEVRESLAPDHLSRIAIDEPGTVLGWIGGIRQYAGQAWELHPLAVDPVHQRRGIGRALVNDLEALVRARGATTLWLGTDDETNRTSIAGLDLYPDLATHLTTIRNLSDHPFTFYQRLGFQIVGFLPDANGPGKPDIFMAKRLQPPV